MCTCIDVCKGVTREPSYTPMEDRVVSSFHNFMLLTGSMSLHVSDKRCNFLLRAPRWLTKLSRFCTRRKANPGRLCTKTVRFSQQSCGGSETVPVGQRMQLEAPTWVEVQGLGFMVWVIGSGIRVSKG